MKRRYVRSPRRFQPLTIAAFAWATSAARAEAPKRHVVDVADFGRIAAAQPHAREALEQGEEALARGDAKAAADSFERAAGEAPRSALVARRHCQALTELGQREQALTACRRAVQFEGSPLDIRALVRAVLSNPNPPTFEDLYEVTLLTARAQKSMPRQPWGYAAQCDIAARVGDAGMLDACRKALVRVAPEHAETKRALAAMRTGEAGFKTTAGWGAILVAVILTCADWIRRTFRGDRAAPTEVGVKSES